MPYMHFSHEQRQELAVLLRAGHKQKKIAQILKKHPSTISRELSRVRAETSTQYDVVLAQKSHDNERLKANQRFRKLGTNKKLTQYVKKKLKIYWSPEQIAGRLKLKYGQMVVWPETIYQYIYRQEPSLRKYLRIQKGKYRKRYGTKQ